MAKKERISVGRKKVEKLYRRFRAILLLTKQITPVQRQKLDATLKRIPELPQTVINNFTVFLPEEIKKLTEYYGVVGSTSDMEYLFDFEYDPRYTVHYVPKYQMSRLFTHYERALPEYLGFPPHARIGIELDGNFMKGAFHIPILEASLFWDMVALWNETLDIIERRKSTPRSRITAKEKAFLRATAKAAFNLVEGYINGIAFDITITRKVSSEEEIKLTEWDKEKERPKTLSLKDKLLQYPKIAKQTQHPPLLESNCREMARILELEKRIRHALIHPTPRTDEHNEHGFRELVFLQLSSDEVGNLCDDVVELIFKLHKTINGMFGRVDNWLYRRMPNGKFSEETYRENIEIISQPGFEPKLGLD